MPQYPLCVTCHSTESEVDVGGQCTICASRASVRDTVTESIRPNLNEPRLRAFELPPDGIADAPSTKDDPTPRPEAPHPKSSGRRLHDYTGLEFLERGGMGVIYRAIESMTGRVVALKTMNVLAHADSRLGHRFRTEATALARLSHPGIVQIFKAGEQDGVPYLAMEFVPGGSLAKRLRTGPRLTPAQVADLMAGVASALAAAHAQQIIHRDLKPGNVLLTEAGRPKLTDFGLACLTDQLAKFTASGATIGTPAYMAPEQADEKTFGPVGPHSDVYGLGAMLYELLTGRTPFPGESPLEILYKVCHDPVVPPRSLNPAVPVELERICLRCLEKRPADRYPSAALVANDLTRYLRGEPVGKPTLAFRFKKVVRRYGKVAAAVMAVSFGAAAMGAALFRDRSEPDRAADSVARQQRTLDAPRPFPLIRPHVEPPYRKWIYGQTLPQVGNDGGYGFLAFEKSGALEICPDTRSEAFELTGEILHRENNWHENGFVGIYLLDPMDGIVRRGRVVGFGESVSDAGKGRTPFVIQDLFVLKYANEISLCLKVPENSPSFPVSANGQRGYRPFTILVRPDRIEATLHGIEDPDGPGQRTVVSSLRTDSLTQTTVNRRLLDAEPESRGHPIGPVPARCSVGLFARYGEIAVKNLVLTPRPDLLENTPK